MLISEGNNSSPESSKWVLEPLWSSIEITGTPQERKDLFRDILLHIKEDSKPNPKSSYSKHTNWRYYSKANKVQRNHIFKTLILKGKRTNPSL